MIVPSPALAFFDLTLPIIVTTDASEYGLGTLLTQLHGGKVERTVSFASITLTEAERKYSVTEKEGLVCVWATEK